jgi:hypothetical protein
MKMKSLIVLGLLFLTLCPAAVLGCLPAAPPPAPLPPIPSNSNISMSPTASSGIGAGLQLQTTAHTLLDEADEKGIDVSAISELIEQADALLEKAQMIRIANPIPANNMAREAITLYEQAISKLEALLD